MSTAKWVGTLGFAIAIGLAAIWAVITGSRPHASAMTPRDHSSYNEAFKSARPITSPSNFLAQTTIRTNGNKISVAMPEVPRSEQQIDFQLFPADTSQRVKIGKGELRLDWIATGYTNSMERAQLTHLVPPGFYSAGLQPIRSDGLKGEVPAHLPFRGKFPEAEFFFAASNLPSFKLVGFQVFDARTHWMLNRGYNSRVHREGLQVGTTMQIWHQAPLQIVITLALGDPEIRFLDLTNTTEIHYKQGIVKLLAGYPKPSNDFNSTSRDDTNVVSFNLAEESGKPTSTFAFLFWPSVSSVPVDINLVGENLLPLKSGGASSMDNLHLATIRDEVPPTSKIQLTYYPHIYRAVFTLPELPGLPEENRNLKNLFDAHIPIMQFMQEYEFASTLGHLVAGVPHIFTLNYPQGYFPRYYTNTTPAELLAELTSLTPATHGPIVFNPETGTLEHRQSLFSRLLRKINNWFN